LLDEDNNTELAKLVEIANPNVEFATMNSSFQEALIYMPPFHEIMGKFGEDNSKPINNVTELPAFDPENSETTESSRFPPEYLPKKFIPDEISGMINKIRNLA
jgi:hypothetical protein